MRSLVQHILRRFELYLAATTTVLFAVVVSMVLVEVHPLATGVVASGSLLGVQFAIQWVDRQRQRRLRAKAIHDIREMLEDRVLNQLAALKVWASTATVDDRLHGIVDDVDQTIDEVAEMVSGLSEEQLDTWQLRYANSDAHRFSMDVGVA